MDGRELPKGHIIGWTTPPATAKPSPLNKNARKRQKRKEKSAAVKDNWEADDVDQATSMASEARSLASTASESGKGSSGTHSPERPNWISDDGADGLADELDKLEMK